MRCFQPLTGQLWVVPLTQVHICSLGPVGAGHVLEDGVQNLLLDLSDGVTVENLHWDLRAVSVVWVDTAQDLVGRREAHGEGSRQSFEGPCSIPESCPHQLSLSRLDWSRMGRAQPNCVPIKPSAF